MLFGGGKFYKEDTMKLLDAILLLLAILAALILLERAFFLLWHIVKHWP